MRSGVQKIDIDNTIHRGLKHSPYTLDILLIATFSSELRFIPEIFTTK